MNLKLINLLVFTKIHMMHRLKWNSVDLHAQIKLLNDFELWMIDFDVTEFSA